MTSRPHHVCSWKLPSGKLGPHLPRKPQEAVRIFEAQECHKILVMPYFFVVMKRIRSIWTLHILKSHFTSSPNDSQALLPLDACLVLLQPLHHFFQPVSLSFLIFLFLPAVFLFNVILLAAPFIVTLHVFLFVIWFPFRRPLLCPVVSRLWLFVRNKGHSALFPFTQEYHQEIDLGVLFTSRGGRKVEWHDSTSRIDFQTVKLDTGWISLVIQRMKCILRMSVCK